MAEGLTIRMFGPFEVRIGGAPLPPLRSETGKHLFALLVLRHGLQVERSWLAGTLWPDSTAEQAASHLRGYLSDLRAALGAEAKRLVSPSRSTLLLDLSGA